MRLHLFLLFSFSHHPFISTIFAYSTSDNKHINQNNSTFNIDLYQCDTNNTILNSTINTNDRIFNNLIDSCSISCCTSNSSNKTSMSIEFIYKISFHVFSVFEYMSSYCTIFHKYLSWSFVLFW